MEGEKVPVTDRVHLDQNPRGDMADQIHGMVSPSNFPDKIS